MFSQLDQFKFDWKSIKQKNSFRKLQVYSNRMRKMAWNGSFGRGGGRGMRLSDWFKNWKTDQKKRIGFLLNSNRATSNVLQLRSVDAYMHTIYPSLHKTLQVARRMMSNSLFSMLSNLPGGRQAFLDSLRWSKVVCKLFYPQSQTRSLKSRKRTVGLGFLTQTCKLLFHFVCVCERESQARRKLTSGHRFSRQFRSSLFLVWGLFKAFKTAGSQREETNRAEATIRQEEDEEIKWNTHQGNHRKINDGN